jgi:hypothetical protein
MVRTTNRNVRTAYHPDEKSKRLDDQPKFEKFQNCFSDTKIVDHPDAEVCRPDARAKYSDSD